MRIMLYAEIYQPLLRIRLEPFRLGCTLVPDFDRSSILSCLNLLDGQANPFPKPDENVESNSGRPHRFGRAKPHRFSQVQHTLTSQNASKSKIFKRSYLGISFFGSANALCAKTGGGNVDIPVLS